MDGFQMVEGGFPIGTAGGGDFLTGLPAREITANGEVRLERVVMTPKTFLWDPMSPPPPVGRLGFSELTVITMARLVNMVPEHEVTAIRRRTGALEAEVERLSDQAASLAKENEALREATEPRMVFVAPDGTEHASRVALANHMAVEAAR